MAEMTREQRIENIIELARGLDPQEKSRVAMRLRCEAVIDAKRQAEVMERSIMDELTNHPAAQESSVLATYPH